MMHRHGIDMHGGIIMEEYKPPELDYNTITHSVAFYAFDISFCDALYGVDRLFGAVFDHLPAIRQDLRELNNLLTMVKAGKYIKVPLDASAVETFEMIDALPKRLSHIPASYQLVFSSLLTKLRSALEGENY